MAKRLHRFFNGDNGLHTKRDIIVIGASAGGIGALQELVSTLPSEIPAALFVVVHIPSWRHSNLPQILSRSGRLPAVPARDNQPIEYGRICVAPPDYHLLLEDHGTILWRGPKENRFRPAINTLFRSAATAFRERVTGVILSGALDDGSAGIWWVDRNGGAAVVQDPAEAAFTDMPESALEYVESACVARLHEMGPLLTRLATGEEVGNCGQKRA